MRKEPLVLVCSRWKSVRNYAQTGAPRPRLGQLQALVLIYSRGGHMGPRTGPLSADDALQDRSKRTAGPAAPSTFIWMQISKSRGVWLTSGKPKYTFTILSTETHHVRLEKGWDYFAFRFGNPFGLYKQQGIVFDQFQGNYVALK